VKVALLHPCFWPEVRRGAERVCHELALGFVARGHHVRLITSSPGPRTVAVEEGVEIVRSRRPSFEDELRARGYDEYLSHLPATVVELARWRPDAVVSASAQEAAVVALWTRRRGIPHVHYQMGVPDRAYLVGRRLRMEALLTALARSDATVALGRAAAEGFERTTGRSVRVISPSIDLDVFRPDPSARAAEPTVFCAASIETPMKRVGLLVEAWPLVRRERPDARLVLLRPRDDALAAELEAHEGVELMPNEGDRLPGAYARAWCSALPSQGESFGLVLAESLACGTPAVGTRHSAITEVLDRPEVGRLFEPDDHPDGLARALLDGLSLSEQPGTAAACRERAQDFSRDRCVERFEALFAELRP